MKINETQKKVWVKQNEIKRKKKKIKRKKNYKVLYKYKGNTNLSGTKKKIEIYMIKKETLKNRKEVKEVKNRQAKTK